MAPARQPGLTNLRRNAGGELQPSERRWALIGAAASAVGFTVLHLALHHPAHAALGVAFSALLAASTRTRKRVIVAVGAVLVGFGPWNFLFLAGAPFYVLALVLLYRARREQEAAGPEPIEVATGGAESVDDEVAARSSTRSKPHPRSKKKKPRTRRPA